MKKRSSVRCLAVFVALFLSVSYAQEYRGRVQGLATDATQAVIVGATVTLLNVNTGVGTVRHTGADGHYLFDLVEPGTYSVIIEIAGFSKFVQENVIVQSRGDVTVNAALKPGSVQEQVTVTDTPVAVQFNTSKVELTVEQRLANTLPQLYRSPYMLAQLDPSVENPNDGQSNYQPYNTWGQNHQKVGGGVMYTNALEVDGSSMTLGVKTSYVPMIDSVQEVVVQQNAVDAEIGHSSGSAISLVTKSGTNEWHGDVFYQGQYPWLNAMEDRTQQSVNKGRNHMFGASLGNPIKKNKLFNFFSWEQWKKIDPATMMNTLPTDLERQGDFSQSLNESGNLRTIYDPWSTTTAADGTVTRTPFANNAIPKAQQDPVAVWYLSKLWQPNRPGTGPYHQDNYYAPSPLRVGYKNFSDRVDYNINDKLRAFGRFGIIRTPSTAGNPTGSEIFVSDRNAWDDAVSYSGDIVYALSPRTLLDVRGDWHRFQDDATAPAVVSGAQGWGQWWPNSDWYKPLFQNKELPVFLPRMEVHRDPGQQLVNMGMGAGFWYQHPDGDSFSVKLSQERGAHYLKFGFDTMANRAASYVAETPGFGFFADLTANTYASPDLTKSGDGYATFLLGALEEGGWGWGGGQTVMPILALKKHATRAYAGFINDDWKISRRLTLNLGLRYEFEQAFKDPEYRLPRPFDPTSPIPEMQQNPVQMPQQVKQYYTGPWNFSGAFHFTDSSNATEWNSGPGALSPRIGAAYRLTDKTSLRVAWARYFTPWVKLIAGTQNYLDVPYPGFDATSYARPTLEGVPQQRLADPFNSSYPLTLPVGKSLGRYTGLGDSITTVYPDRPKQRSDRINFSVQRQLPMDMVLDVTYYLNLTNNLYSSKNLNMVDPRLWYQYKGALEDTIPNPFYNYLTPDKFPGPLRYASDVKIGSLMKPYPQYGDLVVDQYPGGEMRYQSLQLKLQKRFSKGYTLLAGYNYHYETDTVFYDPVAEYLRNWTWQTSENPRHRLSMAGTWDLPIGKGRALGGSIPRALDAIIGGWNANGILSWSSGRYLHFDGLTVTGNPVISNPTRDRWFDTSVFSPLPAYTERTNPWNYAGLTGPGFFNLDASLAKSFSITERIKAKMQMQAFNALNGFTPSDPGTNYYDQANFGKSRYQASAVYGGRLQYGRQLQLGLRLEF